MAFLGDAEQDAGMDTQGKNAQGKDVQEKDDQGKTVQEKEIRACQRIHLETSTSFIPGNRVRHLDYLHLAGTLNPAQYHHLTGLPNPFPLAFRRHQWSSHIHARYSRSMTRSVLVQYTVRSYDVYTQPPGHEPTPIRDYQHSRWIPHI